MKKICLTTVTTKAFIPATMVMVYSFLKHNSWFRGDIVIIHDGLEIKYREYLEVTFKNIKFLQVSTTLKNHLKPVLDLRPDFSDRKARFYALEVFRLRDYEQVLFYDSDILFRGSVQGLLKMDGEFICCGDGLYYANGCRDSISLAYIPDKDNAPREALHNTFSSGFLLVNHLLLADKYYQGLLALLNTEQWKQIEVRLTDQAVFLLYFAGKQTLVSSTYNYLLRHRTHIETKTDVRMDNALVWHFNGPINPWIAEQVMSEALDNPHIIKAMCEWSQTYADVLQSLHIKTKFQNISQDMEVK